MPGHHRGEESRRRRRPLPHLPARLPLPPFLVHDPLPCGFVRNPAGLLGGSGRTIAEMLSYAVGPRWSAGDRQAGLTGLYDFALKFAPESAGSNTLLRLLSPGTPPPAVDSNAPSLAAALQEQLGVKLEGRAVRWTWW